MRRGRLIGADIWVTLATVIGMIVMLLCAGLALDDAGFGDRFDTVFLAGASSAFGVTVMTMIGARRSLLRTRQTLPATLTEVQRDLVVSASRGGPLPDDLVIRAEARRLAERRAEARGGSLRVNALVFAGLAVAAALAGALASPWWWGVGLMFLVAVAHLSWQDRRWTHQLGALSDTTGPDLPSVDGIYRVSSRHAERLPELRERTGRRVLHIELRRPPAGTAATSVIRLNDQLVPSEWGTNIFMLPTGDDLYRIQVSADFSTEYGHATMTVDVPPGQRVVVHYSPPAWRFGSGRMGVDRQPRPGALASALLTVGIVTLIIVLIATGS